MPASEEDRASDLVALANKALETFRNQYGVTVDDKGRCGYVENDGTGIVRPCDKVAVEHAFIRAYGTQLMPSTIKQQLVTAWTAASKKILFKAIRPFVFKSEALKNGEFAWNRLSFDPALTTPECPSELGRLLSRTKQADNLVLWIGSILDYEFPRTQYLYMYGPGSDGKSLLARIIEHTLGSHCCTTIYPQDLSASHGTTKLEGIRVAMFKDESDTSFVSGGPFKRLTGDEMITINPKGEPHRNILLNCKVLIYSNEAPNLRGGRADMRRIVPVEFVFRPGGTDLDFEKAALAAGANILQYCYHRFRAWKEQHPNSDLSVDEDIAEDIKSSSYTGEIEERLRFDYDIDATRSEWRTSSKDLQLWAKVNVEGTFGAVTNVLRGLGLGSESYREEGKSVRGWNGIRFREKDATQGVSIRAKIRNHYSN